MTRLDRLRRHVHSCVYFVRIAPTRLVCLVRGHDFGSGPFAPAYYLHGCLRGCGAELLGRPIEAINDLEPPPEDVREEFERIDYENDCKMRDGEAQP